MTPACRTGRRNTISSFGAGPLFGLQSAKASLPRRDLILTCSPTPSFWSRMVPALPCLPPGHPRSDPTRRIVWLSLAPNAAAERGIAAGLAHGYGFAKGYGKPTIAAFENDSEIRGVLNGLAVCRPSRLRVVQCDT